MSWNRYSVIQDWLACMVSVGTSLKCASRTGEANAVSGEAGLFTCTGVAAFAT